MRRHGWAPALLSLAPLLLAASFSVAVAFSPGPFCRPVSPLRSTTPTIISRRSSWVSSSFVSVPRLEPGPGPGRRRTDGREEESRDTAPSRPTTASLLRAGASSARDARGSVRLRGSECDDDDDDDDAAVESSSWTEEAEAFNETRVVAGEGYSSIQGTFGRGRRMLPWRLKRWGRSGQPAIGGEEEEEEDKMLATVSSISTAVEGSIAEEFGPIKDDDDDVIVLSADEAAPIKKEGRRRGRRIRRGLAAARRKLSNRGSKDSASDEDGGGGNAEKERRRELAEAAKCAAVVENVHELRDACLVNRTPLEEVGFNLSSADAASCRADGRPERRTAKFQRNDPAVNQTAFVTTTTCADTNGNGTSEHPVLRLMRQRAASNSIPGARDLSNVDDSYHLALAIEGGGMRGAVSAGMAAALATLGLTDTFDSVYGSSAGSVVGAYLVSRQLSVDIYTDIMPAAGGRFASKRRGAVNFGVDLLGDAAVRTGLRRRRSGASGGGGGGSDGANGRPDDDKDGGGDGERGVSDDDGVELPGAETSAVSSSEVSHDGGGGRVKKGRRRRGQLLFGRLSASAGTAIRAAAAPVASGLGRARRALPALTLVDDVASTVRPYLRRKPGMNLTFVLDGIMCDRRGLRPFDAETFRANDARQPLRVVSSTVAHGGEGELETVAFGSSEGDFWGFRDEEWATGDRSEEGTEGGEKSGNVGWRRKITRPVRMMGRMFRSAWRFLRKTASNAIAREREDSTGPPLLPPGSKAMFGISNRPKRRKKDRRRAEARYYEPTGCPDNPDKKGLFPCLESSMLVPGAAGPPVKLLRSKNRRFVEGASNTMKRPVHDMVHLCFDAFAYEPIPYRSAVESGGATHVLALRSRPDGCVVETKPHLYERLVGPLYFRSHGLPRVADFFRRGGSQYRYLEDVLTLNEGLAAGLRTDATASSDNGDDIDCAAEGVKVPPTRILFGTDEDQDIAVDTASWRRAHLLPVTVPFGTPELPTLSQDKDEVLRAVRHGYAAAFDMLAPVAGLAFNGSATSGIKVAEMLFPDRDAAADDVSVLETPVNIKGGSIGNSYEQEKEEKRTFVAWLSSKRKARREEKERMSDPPGGALATRERKKDESYHEMDQYVRDGGNMLEWLETEALLAALPGLQEGKLPHLVPVPVQAQDARLNSTLTA